MKYLCIILALILVLSTEKAKFSDKPNYEFTPSDFEGMVSAFLHGIRVDLVSNSTIP
jgi:hypothetical protein